MRLDELREFFRAREVVNVLVLAAVAAISVGVSVALWSAPDNIEQTDAKYSKTSPEHCDAKLRTFDRYRATLPNKPPTDKREQTSREDFCQQIRIAEATEDAATYGARQFWVSIFSLILVASAAWWAKRAVQTSERIAERQLRPYLHFTNGEAKFSLDPGGLWVQDLKAEFKNSGATPAIVTRIVTVIIRNVCGPDQPPSRGGGGGGYALSQKQIIGPSMPMTVTTLQDLCAIVIYDIRQQVYAKIYYGVGFRYSGPGGVVTFEETWLTADGYASEEGTVHVLRQCPRPNEFDADMVEFRDMVEYVSESLTRQD